MIHFHWYFCLLGNQVHLLQQNFISGDSVVRDGNDITNEAINSLIYSLIHD